MRQFLASSTLVRGLALMAMFLFAATCGCDSADEEKIYPLQGKIIFADGSPAMFGDIEFQSSRLPTNARGKIKRDGTFVVRTNGKNGAIQGEHKIVIVQVVTNHFNLDVVHDHGDLVHEKYSSYATTDLKATIKPGTNEIVLEVEKREDK